MKKYFLEVFTQNNWNYKVFGVVPPQTFVKPMKNNVFCQSKKKTSQGILRLFKILQKALGKQRFQHRGRMVPGKATLGPPAPTPGISPMPYGNHWKNKGFRTSVKVERG